MCLNKRFINWSKEKEIKETISAAKLTEYQSILKIYEQNRKAKIEYFAELSQKIKKELIQRDLSRIPAEKLFKLALESEEKLRALVPCQEFGGGFPDFDFEANPSFTLNPKD